MRGLISGALALALLATPSFGEDAPQCWMPGDAVDIFGWSDDPARACRDAALSATQVSPLPTGPTWSSPPTSRDTGTPDGVEFTFSGQASVGVAVAF